MNNPAYAYEHLKEVYANLPYALALGMKFVSGSFRTSQTMSVDWREDLTAGNHNLSLHESVITTLIDTLGALAVAATMTEIKAILTLDLRIDFLYNPEPYKTIYANAYSYETKGQIYFVRVHCYQDDENKPFALGTNTYMQNMQPLQA